MTSREAAEQVAAACSMRGLSDVDMIEATIAVCNQDLVVAAERAKAAEARALIGKIAEALEGRVHPESSRCPVCDRDACTVNSTQAERDLAWGAFDAAKARANGYQPEHEGLRDVAFAASKTVTNAEADCWSHKVNWRVRTLIAEARIGLAIEAIKCVATEEKAP